MLKYEIEGSTLPVVICYPEAGQTLCTQSGAMSWMSDNMNMETNISQAHHTAATDLPDLLRDTAGATSEASEPHGSSATKAS